MTSQESWNKKAYKSKKRRSKYFDKPATLDQSTAKADSRSKQSFPHCPWGGKTAAHSLVNTCSIDNMLFMIHLLITSRDDIKQWLASHATDVAATLLKVSELFGSEQWAEGKLLWVEQFINQKPPALIDLYGTEYEKFVRVFAAVQETETTRQCTNRICNSQPLTRKNQWNRVRVCEYILCVL